jgi:hypothetical protein
VGIFFQLNIRRARDQGFDAKCGEGDEVRFPLGAVRGNKCDEGMADLFDMDRAREGRFLGIITLKLEERYINAGYEGNGC